jgi:hypothetical protein
MKLFKVIFTILFAFIVGSDALDASGFGESSREEVDTLLKALEAQEGVSDIADLKDGGALQPQSLETQLAMLTFQEQHIKLYNDIGKGKAFSTLEEYNTQDGYGQEGGFVSQLENPVEADPSFERNFSVIKFIRELWRTADVLQASRTVVDPGAVNVQAAMMRCLRTTERSLFTGDSNIIPQSFDGIETIVANNGSPDHTVDFAGQAITERVFRDAAELIKVNYGIASHCYLSPSMQTEVDNIMYGEDRQRYNQEQVSKGTGRVSLGLTVEEMRTSFGNIAMRNDIFVDYETTGVPTVRNANKQIVEGSTSEKAPGVPSFTLTPNAGPVAGSLWAASGRGGINSGEYGYRVSAINQYGKSIAAAIQKATVVDGGSISISITANGAGQATLGYEIYRETAVNSGVYRLMKRIKNDAAPTVYVDLNEDLPGFGKMYIVDNTPDGPGRTMKLQQLAPMHKTQYAKIGPYDWGAVNFYVVPQFYAPLRFVVIKNIAVTSASASPLINL